MYVWFIGTLHPSLTSLNICIWWTCMFLTPHSFILFQVHSGFDKQTTVWKIFVWVYFITIVAIQIGCLFRVHTGYIDLLFYFFACIIVMVISNCSVKKKKLGLVIWHILLQKHTLKNISHWHTLRKSQQKYWIERHCFFFSL